MDGKHAAPAREWVSPAARRWLYGIATALIPLLVAYGIIDNVRAPLWVALAAQVLATATAYAHTPTPESEPPR